MGHHLNTKGKRPCDRWKGRDRSHRSKPNLHSTPMGREHYPPVGRYSEGDVKGKDRRLSSGWGSDRAGYVTIESL